jgi:glycosyltransferase involved in cell wall biosynthesis
MISIDCSRISEKHRTGTENYSYHIVREIAKLCDPGEVRLYTRSYIDDPAFNSVDQSSIIARRMWTQYGLMKKTWRDNPSVLFVPAHVIPFLKKPDVPVVVTIHDLRTEFLPQHSSLLQKLYLNKAIERLRIEMAEHIIAVSESTKKDAIILGAKESRVTVIYEGVDVEFFDIRKKYDEKSMAQVLKKYSLDEEGYLFFVGTVQPRKNLERLIEAFASSRSRNKGKKLVIAGKKGWMSDSIYQKPFEMKVEQDVEFLDYVPFEDLPYLYAGAMAFVYPSLYEGFGLPILESFAMGTPVMTSDISSMPEVGGDVAVYVNPFSIESMANGIDEVTEKPRDEGAYLQQARKFSWENAGMKTLELLRQIANRKR